MTSLGTSRILRERNGMTTTLAQEPRLILFHKQSTSARLRFLKFSYGAVCGLTPLPPLAQLLDEAPDEKLLTHPAHTVNAAIDYFALDSEGILAEGDYRAFVEIPQGTVQVFLAQFTHIDPPFAAAQSRGAEFIDLTQARDLPDVELELLRRAYELLLGG